ncbi:MAG: Mini-ribonuclease 3 [Christensenellaceae bacterium]
MSIIDPIGKKEARLKNILVLAYAGDTVYDLYVRTALLKDSRAHVGALNDMATRIVNAKAQADIVEKLMPILTEEEQAIYKRGRNAKPGTVAKNMSLADYKSATGFEAVIGYLYLSGEKARVEELMGYVLKEHGVV